MSDQIPCPACGALLMTRPDLAGEPVRCPSCRTVFALAQPVETPTVAVPAWYPPEESEPLPEVIPLEPEPAAGGFDWTGCQPAGVHVLRATDWRTARDGLRLVFWVHTFALVVAVAGGTVLLSAWGEAHLSGILFFLRLAGFAALLLMTVGLFMCARLPHGAWGRVCAQVSAWMNIAFLGYMVLEAVVLAPSKPAPDIVVNDGMGRVYLLRQAPPVEDRTVSRVLATVWLSGATVLWLLFLRRATTLFGGRRLARMASLLIIWFGSSVAALAVAFLASLGPGELLSADFQEPLRWVFAADLVALSVFHLLVIGGFAGVIDEAQRRARRQVRRS